MGLSKLEIEKHIIEHEILRQQIKLLIGDLGFVPYTGATANVVLSPLNSNTGLIINKITGEGVADAITINLDGSAIVGITKTGEIYSETAQIGDLNFNIGSANVIESAVGDLTIKAQGGDISFDNENLTTTGTLGAGATTVTSLKIPQIGGTVGKFNIFQGGANTIDLTYTLPTGYPAVNGYVLSATTAGVMSWAVAGGGAQTPWASDIAPAGYNLLDNAGTPLLSIDPNNRILYKSDGTTPAFDWENQTLLTSPMTADLDMGTYNINNAGTGTFGGFQLGTSTTAGFVLTADASGIGTWQSAGAGSQTPWGQNIDANGYNLTGLGDGTNTLDLCDGSYAVNAVGVVNIVQGSYTALFGGSAGGYFTDASNYVYLADGTYAINATGSNYETLTFGGQQLTIQYANVVSNGGATFSGLQSGAGAPATINTTGEFYVDTNTGLLYVQ